MYDLADYYGLYSGSRVETFIHCPFHTETTPSARFYRDGLMFCFGCNKMYNPITFVMGMEDLEYKEAITWLEEKYDFKTPPELFKRKLDEDEKAEWKIKIMEYKYVLPFKQYLELWRLFDKDELNDNIFKRILFNSGVL